jgi:hypothetical protein
MAPPAKVVAYLLVDAILIETFLRLASTHVPGSMYEDGQGTEGSTAPGISNSMSTTGSVDVRVGRQWTIPQVICHRRQTARRFTACWYSRAGLIENFASVVTAKEMSKRHRTQAQRTSPRDHCIHTQHHEQDWHVQECLPLVLVPWHRGLLPLHL